MNYAELQVTTHFSFLRGVSSAEELFSAAALLGIKALGVTDRNSLAGLVRAHEAAKVTGVRLLVGCRLDLQCGTSMLVLPLRHDPATGAISTGGRYLFRAYEDATKYRDFLEAKVFPGEQTTFWKRSFFFNTVRFAWRVIGAHDLAPITTHDLNRFERYSVSDAKFEARLPELFPAFLEATRRLGLAHVSLMFQPEHNLVGVLTAAAREGRQAPSFETVRLSTDALALRGSVSEARLTELGARKIFDRTSLNLAVWLPLSEEAGGASAIWPNSPPIPAPGVEHLGGAQPKAA